MTDIVHMLVEREHMAAMHCRFGCDSPVVGIFNMPQGCICWNDPVQALCDQHAISAESLGSITCVVDFRKYTVPD